MMKKVCVIGHFGFGKNATDGQTIKTMMVTDALKKAYGDAALMKFDTHGGVKTLHKMPFWVCKALKNAENIIILPAQRGLRIIAPLLVFFNRRYHRRLHYCVIGGWLPELLENKPFLVKQLRRFDRIYVETNTMKAALEKMGFSNLCVMHNCKELKILDESELTYPKGEPFRLCTFSRVVREKGIEDAVRAVEKINRIIGKTVFTLDIFGQIDAQQEEWFRSLSHDFSDAVRYCGIVPFDQSTDMLKDYFAVLFPTHYFTEGIPGTIIDAYAAGVPVIAARWESFCDIINDGVTGIGYLFDEEEGLYHALAAVCDDPESILRMKSRCLSQAARYLPENALIPLFQQLGA